MRQLALNFLPLNANWYQATTNEQVTILQDLLLAVNTQLNHDLAIALLRTGIEDETEKNSGAEKTAAAVSHFVKRIKARG